MSDIKGIVLWEEVLDEHFHTDVSKEEVIGYRTEDGATISETIILYHYHSKFGSTVMSYIPMPSTEVQSTFRTYSLLI